MHADPGRARSPAVDERYLTVRKHYCSSRRYTVRILTSVPDDYEHEVGTLGLLSDRRPHSTGVPPITSGSEPLGYIVPESAA